MGVFPRIAEALGVSEAKLYDIATFYENFSLESKGKHDCGFMGHRDKRPDVVQASMCATKPTACQHCSRRAHGRLFSGFHRHGEGAAECRERAARCLET